MSILSSIGRIATEFSAARARYQTERAIRSLPIELQKDIGWPEAGRHARSGIRHGVGSLGWSEVIHAYQYRRPAARAAPAGLFCFICSRTSRPAMSPPHDAYEQSRIAARLST